MEIINKLYVGLGVPSTVASAAYSDWYCYTPGNNSWERKAEFPGGRANAWSFAINEDIYIGGGADSTNFVLPMATVTPSYTYIGTYVVWGVGGSDPSMFTERISPNTIIPYDYPQYILANNLLQFGIGFGPHFGNTGSVIYANSNKALLMSSSLANTWAVITDENSGNQTATVIGVVSPPYQYTFYCQKSYTFDNYNSAFNWYNYYANSSSPPITITKYFKDIWKYNAHYNNWNKMSTPPASITESAWSKSLGFSVGSYGFIINEESGETYKYTPNSDSWSKVASYPAGLRRYLNRFIVSTTAYVGGGATGSNKYNDWYSYNYLTDTWSSIATFIGTSVVGADSFSASGRGYVVGGYGPTYLNTAYEYIPSVNGWTTTATAIGNAVYFGIGLTTPDAGYNMLGINTTAAYTQNYQYTGSWQSKTLFIGTARCFPVGDTVTLNTLNNYIYYTTGSMSACPTLCNLWAIKVNNYDDVSVPTVICPIPIATDTYWQAPTYIPAKYNNSIYPMDIVANNNYVVVTQWRYSATSSDCPTGSNYHTIGIRASSGNPLISSWVNQTTYYDESHVKFPLGLTLRNNVASGSFIAHGINNIIIKEVVMQASIVGTSAHLIIPNYIESNFVATQYNVATYGIKNTLSNISDISKIKDAILYMTPSAFPYGLSKMYPANTTIINDSDNSKDIISERLYWDQNIKDGE